MGVFLVTYSDRSHSTLSLYAELCDIVLLICGWVSGFADGSNVLVAVHADLR